MRLWRRSFLFNVAVPPAAVSGTFVAVGAPAVRVVAATVCGANNDRIPRRKRIFAQGTLFTQKWGLLGDGDGGEHGGGWGLETGDWRFNL